MRERKRHLFKLNNNSPICFDRTHYISRCGMKTIWNTVYIPWVNCKKCLKSIASNKGEKNARVE